MDDVNIRVLIYRDRPSEPWIARGLEHDIFAQADTLEEVHKRFRMQVAAYLMAGVELGEKLADVKPAPQDIWDMFQRAKIETVSEPTPIRTSPHMDLPHIVTQFRVMEPVLAAE